MPEPLAYLAWRNVPAMLISSCGVPVTATSRSYCTVTTIRSPNPYVSPLAGLLRISSALTNAGAIVPSTLCPACADSACVPSPSEAASEASRPSLIAPLFSVNAPAATSIPSGSESAATTTYWNFNTFVPVPLAYAACRAVPPTSSASCGVPPVVTTSTGRLNVTSTSIVSVAAYVSSTTGALATDAPLTAAAVRVPDVL